MKMLRLFLLRCFPLIILFSLITIVKAQTCSGGLAGSGLQDCVGSDTSPCRYCDVSDMDYEIRAPDGVTTTGWRDMTYSTQVGTCSVSCVQETWTASYLWCPQEGTYSMRTRAYAQGGSGYAWETSDWNTNAYTVNYDYEQMWCTCKGGTWLSGATYCGSLGCQGGKCCGDDGANDNFCVAGGGSCVAGTYYTNHCSDGVQNCDEQGVDCGGAYCTPCDNIPPVTTDNAPSGWQTSDVTVTLTCTDNNSGCAQTNYCVDDTNTCTPTSIYSTPITISCVSGSTCIKYLRYYSKDNAGNQETTKSATIRIDKQAPTTNITPDGQSWTKDDVNFTLSCSDGSGSGCSLTEYKIIDANQTCDTTGLTSGSSGTVTCTSGTVCQKRVCYRSKDNVGNYESIKTSNIFYIDKKNPTYVGYSNIQGYSYQESSTVFWVKGGDDFKISITHSDVGSGVYRQYFGFNKDDCNPNSCGGAPYEIKSHSIYGSSVIDWMFDDNYIDINSVSCVDSDVNCSDDDMTLQWSSNIKTTCQDWDYKLHTYLYDKVSNGVGYTDLGVWVKVDNSPPTTSLLPNGATWTNVDINFTLSCYDSRSGCSLTEYKIIDANQTCDTTGLTSGSSGTVTCTSGTVCQKRVCYRSKDNVGNYESIKTSNIFYIDKQAPTTTDNAPATWQTSDFNIILVCNDGSGAGCSATYYRINNGAWQTYSESISITQDGNHRIDYYSKDVLNNTENVKTCYAPLDKTPPAIDVNSPLANEVIESTIYVRFRVNKGLGSPLDFNSITVLLDGTESDDFIRTEHCIESSGDYICSYYEYVNTAKDYNLSIIASDEVGWTAQQDINFLYLGYTSFNIEGYIVEPSTPMAGTNYSMMDVGLSLFGGSLCAAAKCIETGFPAIFRNIPPVLVYAGYEEGYFNGDLNIRFYAADYEMGELHTKIAYSTSKGSFQNSIVNDLNLNNYQNIDRLSCASTDWRYSKLCTYEWDTTQASDGNYYLDLNLWDEHGANSSYSTTNTLCIDNTAPDINVINPQPNEIIEDPWVMFKISENGCAPLVLSSISVLLDGEATSFDYVRDCNESGSEYTCGFNIIGLVERDYNLSIIVSDLATNKRQVDVNFRFIPKISVSVIQPSGTLETGDVTISFNVYNTSLSELHAKIYYSSIYSGKLGFENAIETDLNLNNHAEIEKLNCTSNVWWPPVQCTYYWDASNVADGNYYIDINIWTNEGLTVSASSLKQFLIDNTPPKASITDVSETTTYEDTIYLNCTDSGSGCVQTRWYYFNENNNCSSNKEDYVYSINSNTLKITEDNNNFICLWVEDNVGLSARAVSSKLNVYSTGWSIVKGTSETISEATLDLNNTCTFYITSDINLVCDYQSYIKIRGYPVDISKVSPILPSLIEASERPIQVLFEASITNYYDPRYFIIFEGETTRITSKGTEQDYPNIVVRRRAIPLLKPYGSLELGTLIIKAKR